MIRPLADRLLVRPIEEATKTAGGLFIPTIAQEKPQQGEVVALGPGRVTDHGILIPLTLKKGEIVTFSKYSGTELTDEKGKTVLLMKEADILAVVGEAK